MARDQWWVVNGGWWVVGDGWATRGNVTTDWPQPHQPSNDPCRYGSRTTVGRSQVDHSLALVSMVEDGWWE